MTNNKQITNNKKGFTLIELLIYIGLLTLIMSATIQFAWDIIYGRVKSQVHQEVSQNLRLATKRIEYEIRNASAINTASGSTLSLAMSDSSRNPTIFTLSGGRIRIGYGSSGNCPTSSPCFLTSNLTNVSALAFTNLSTTNTKNVRFSITLNHINPSNLKEWQWSQTYNGSAEVRLK